MDNKLLAIKKDNNIIIYNVSFNKNDISDYVKYLEQYYGYNEKCKNETTIIKDKAISMGKYDFMKKYCKINENYKVLEDIKVFSDTTKLSLIEFEVHYYSMVSKALEDMLLNDKKLINTTELLKLCNHLYGYRNNFEFNEILDLNGKNRNWDDPSRYLFNSDDYKQHIGLKKNMLNEDDVKLNKIENKRIYEDLATIVERIKTMLKIEQIGMFPIEKEMPRINEILTIFGKRNEEFEFLYGTLENQPVDISGARIINQLNSEIVSDYDYPVDNPAKEKINLLSQVNSFLKF
ncbi:MAG TPA: hypothetical protein PLV83_04325 [Bacilli bacterium]|nr:hypothetical protein [Bacilli bacterium]